MSESFVGIDVSKAHLDFHLRPAHQSQRFANDEAGIKRLVDHLAELQPAFVVLEATGGLEMPLMLALADRQLDVAQINPRLARDFAKASNKLAKTDAIDAAVLAHYGEAFRPKPTVIPTEEMRQLRELLDRRQQLVGNRVMEQNRLASTVLKSVRSQIKAHLSYLDKQIAQVEKQMTKLISQTEATRRKDEILQSVPGIGPQVARTLIIRLPELGTLERQPLAALVGLAPMHWDSGQMKGSRHIRGGRRDVRVALYQGALTASVHNPMLKAFYLRLLAASKSKMVALIAVARKLLVVVNAMVAKNQMWRADSALPM